MAYTAPPTVLAGNIYTPVMYNTYLQNNADSGYMRMLADTTLGGAAASIDFTSIPATFAHLMLVVCARSDTAALTTSILVRLNNDSAANYDSQYVLGNGGTASAAETFAGTSVSAGNMPGGTAPANLFGQCDISIAHYAGSANNKVLRLSAAVKAGVTTTLLQSALAAGFWRSSAAINRITLIPAAGNFAAGSRATLYGLPQ